MPHDSVLVTDSSPVAGHSLPGGRPRGRRWPFWVVSGVCMAALLWYALNPRRFYRAMCETVVTEVGIMRVQQWAISVFFAPPLAFGSHDPVELFAPTVPANIGSISATHVYYIPADPTRTVQEHILFSSGSGHYHYGVIVGRPGYTPTSYQFGELQELTDGVWGIEF